jgi:hypothetical protein
MNFEFADSTPTKNAAGRKHRRGKGSQKSSSSSYGSSSKSSKYSSAAATSLDALPTPGGSKSIDQDQNSCAGSLTYSASSSVFSADDSADSSFAEIIKILDTGEAGEGGASSKIKAYMAERPQERQNACGMDASPAVAGWMQRIEERSKEQQKLRSHEQEQSATSMISAEMQYSNDDSSDDEELKMLGTIGGDKGDDDFALPKTTQQVAKQPFRTTTPPPNTRQRRTSTPPGEIPLVRTSSRHSKSSSDGSFGTPAPSSPPSYAKSHLKPPPRAVSQYSKAKTKTSPVKDISEPVYKNFWMCGFTDAFKFDGFKE